MKRILSLTLGLALLTLMLTSAAIARPDVSGDRVNMKLMDVNATVEAANTGSRADTLFLFAASGDGAYGMPGTAEWGYTFDDIGRSAAPAGFYGVDNTASCYGGILLYQVKDGEKGSEPIRPAKPIEVVLANSGVTANTAELDGLVQREKARDPVLFAERMRTITRQALAVRQNLEQGHLGEVGRTMTENHRILIDMGLSHEILVHLCDLALGQGALGAKLTGGGMGGYMVALTPGTELQERVATAMESKGYAVIRAAIGGGPT